MEIEILEKLTMIQQWGIAILIVIWLVVYAVWVIREFFGPTKEV
jgi:hypothetical protein